MRRPTVLWDSAKKVFQLAGVYLGTRAAKIKPLVLYGVAGFFWDQERIPEQDVRRCLDYYEARVKSSIHTTSQTSPSLTPEVTPEVKTTWTSWLTLRAKEKKKPAALSEQEIACQELINKFAEFYSTKSKESLSRLPKFGLIKKDRWGYRMSLIIAEKARESMIRVIGGPAVVDMIRDNKNNVLKKAYSFIQANIESSSRLHVTGDPITDLAAIEIGFSSESHVVPEWCPVAMSSTYYPIVNYSQPEPTSTHLNALEKSTHTFDQILGSDSILDRSIQDQAVELYHSFMQKSLTKAQSILRKQIPTNTESCSVVESIPTTGNSASKQDTSIAYLADWELFIKEPSYMVFRKPYANTGLFQFKVVGSYKDVTASDFYEVQFQEKLRMSWDEYVTKQKTIDSDPDSNCQVVHWVMKFPFPMAKREYVYVHKKWTSPNEDAIVFVNKSVKHPEAPEGNGATRVRDYYSEMVIKAHSSIDKPGIDYELTYFDDPQVVLPSSVVSWVATSATPDFLNKVYKAALKRRELTTKEIVATS